MTAAAARLTRSRSTPARRLVAAVTTAMAMAAGMGTIAPLHADTQVGGLGGLERESLDDALAALHLHVDPHPDGKVVGRIYVVNQDVFSRHDWYFQLLNIFHRTTRPDILARELLIQPGQRYDQALVEESVRNLQTPPTLIISNRTKFSPPELSSVVALVPIASPLAGTVDLLAVTRDVWSLRFNSNFEFQQNTLSLLSTSLSENNLFGWRKYLDVGFEMDQGRYGVGPSYFDPNVAGSRLTLLAAVTAWYARDGDRYEGDNELFSLRYPLYALASRWGAGVDVTHQDAVVRSFRGNSLRVEDLAATPDTVEMIPYIYRRRILTTDASVVRSFGDAVIQRVIVGHRFDRRRSLTIADVPGAPATPAEADEFLAEFAPLSEVRSEPYVRYEMFTARYGVFRDLDTFDLRENHQLGPSLKIEVAASLPALGADYQTFPLGAVASWAVAPGGDAYGYALVQASSRVRDGHLVDQNLTTRISFATPPIARVARLVLFAGTDAVRADTHRTRFFLGGSTGLRGYAIGDFEGTAEFVVHVELRSKPVAVYSQRFGALVFYDAGDAAPSFDALVPYHDAGIGLRWLIPQLNSSVLRFDWAVAMQSTTLTRAGLPGRFSAGYLQTF